MPNVKQICLFERWLIVHLDTIGDWINERDNMNTATNPNSRWLFPGRRTGQPMHPASLAAQVNKLGVPTSSARTAAIRQHVLAMPAPVVADALAMPAPVVADALSYHPVTVAKIATQAGSPGAVTPPKITQELATVDYASSPVSTPDRTGRHADRGGRACVPRAKSTQPDRHGVPPSSATDASAASAASNSRHASW